MMRPAAPRDSAHSFLRTLLVALLVINGCFVFAAFGLMDQVELAEQVERAQQGLMVFCVGLALAFAATVTWYIRGQRWRSISLALTLAGALVFLLGLGLAIYATVRVASV
jgi:hypothetical protein